MNTCSIGIHKWEMWSEFVPSHSRLTQFRKCKNCGKIKYRDIYGNQATPTDVNKALKNDT